MQSLVESLQKGLRILKRPTAEGILDLNHSNFITPVSLLPLVGGIRSEDFVAHTNPNVQNWVETVLQPIGPHTEYTSGTYMPLIDVPPDASTGTSFLNLLHEFVDDGRELGGRQAFNYLIGEITDNMHEHANFSAGYVLCQTYPRGGWSEIALYDDGQGIRGSFEAKGMRMNNDTEAIIAAVDGLSSKNEKQRGTGLRSNMRLWTEAAGAQLLIASGNGACLYWTNENSTYKLGEEFILQGTLIGLRLPYPLELDGQQLYEFVG